MSRKAIPLETNYLVEELEVKLTKISNTRVYRRLTSIIAIMKDESREVAAKLGKMSTDVLCEWVKRFNESGLEGLYDLKSTGRPPKLQKKQRAKLIKNVEKGPNPKTYGVNRWRLYDLVQFCQKTFGVQLVRATVWNILKKEGFSLQSPRPRHPKQNPADIPKFKKEFRALVKHKTTHVAKGIQIQVWFQDEARIGQKNNRAKIWARVGKRPTVLADMGYQSGYLFGAICPALGKAVGLVMPNANTDATQRHLDLISQEITDQAHGVLIMDRATWHTTKKLKIPDNITIIYLPPYCPELNSIEQVWDFLRENYLSNQIYPSWKSLNMAICLAWKKFCQSPEKINEIGTRKWAILT